MLHECKIPTTWRDVRFICYLHSSFCSISYFIKPFAAGHLLRSRKSPTPPLFATSPPTPWYRRQAPHSHPPLLGKCSAVQFFHRVKLTVMGETHTKIPTTNAPSSVNLVSMWRPQNPKTVKSTKSLFCLFPSKISNGQNYYLVYYTDSLLSIQLLFL